jgi:hypothetical protein
LAEACQASGYSVRCGRMPDAAAGCEFVTSPSAATIGVPSVRPNDDEA